MQLVDTHTNNPILPKPHTRFCDRMPGEPGAPFPNVEEICTTVDDPRHEDTVLRRLSAPVSYLPAHERMNLKQGVRLASRCMRTWIFDEPDVQNEKRRLGVYRGPQSDASYCEFVRLADFRREYSALLAESCVLQRSIAETLTKRNPRTGRQTYVESVRDAMERHDRQALLRRALDLFGRSFAHEQRRFALGSSLKSLVQRELGRYPVDAHQLLLTSTRGDFWSHYDRDLLSFVDDPTPEARKRLMALYFDQDEAGLERAVQRMRALPADAAKARRRAHEDRRQRLAVARIQKGYARLGDLRFVCPGTRSDAKSNIGTIDQLLWVDNVLEKHIDHKHLLHHELFLRLHLMRLAVASWLGARGVRPSDVSDVMVRDAIQALLGRATVEGISADKQREQRAELLQLQAWFGEEARVFTRPDTEIVLRLEAWLRPRPTRSSPRAAQHVGVAA